VHTLAAPQPALHGRRFGPLGCHGSSPADAAKFQSLHSGFATAGLTPGVPSTWTILRAAGDPPVVPGTNNALFNGGGSYDIAHDWITLGDYGADSATEYDASSGVHNPKYIVACLAKAQELAKSVNGSFANVRGTELVKRGATAVVAGKVVSGDKSAGANAKLVLMKGSKSIATANADANGDFAFSFRATSTGTYTVVWPRRRQDHVQDERQGDRQGQVAARRRRHPGRAGRAKHKGRGGLSPPRPIASAPRRADLARSYASASACSRSRMRSPASSMPTE